MLEAQAFGYGYAVSMSARDLYHNAVRHALEKDGWTITDDPFTLKLERRNAFVDLGAERLLGAERGLEKIAVEIKSFLSESFLSDFEQALGQYMMYQAVMRRLFPDRSLVLAVPESAFQKIVREGFSRLTLEAYPSVRIMGFDPKSEEVRAWQPSSS